MFEEMDFDGLMNQGIDTVYGLHNPKTQEIIIVSDLRRFDHGEYRVEKGNVFWLETVWSHISKQRCIEKAKEIAKAAG